MLVPALRRASVQAIGKGPRNTLHHALHEAGQSGRALQIE